MGMKKTSIFLSLLLTLGTVHPAFAFWQGEIPSIQHGSEPTPQEYFDLSGRTSNRTIWPSLSQKEIYEFSIHKSDILSYSYKESILCTNPTETLTMHNPHDSSDVMVTQADSDKLSHQALANALQANDMFYFVTTGGSLPILDETFRDFIDYGASASFGAGKRITEKLSITATIGLSMMTGDWSVKGDRESIEVAAEEYYPGIVTEPGVVITPEDLDDVNLGISYHGDAEATITSAESLEKIDVHTDMYLFPVSINALYRIKQSDKFSAYAGGGLGFCVAIRDCDSSALKSKYFSGPEYKVSLNHSQTVTGLLVNLTAGIDVPIYEKLKFVAEASSTLYDLNSFDPILEISFTKPNPAWYEGSDLSQWSYEDPLRVGVFKEVYVTSLSAGFVMPF